MIATIIQFLVATIFIIVLMYLALKLGGNKYITLNDGKYIKIIERTQLSKENFILLAKIGEEGYVLSSTQKSVDILLKLEKGEIDNIELQKKQQFSKYAFDYSSVIKKLNKKKEDKYEKE
ncbi:flagellar biosynthetic protein FliO [Clostridium cellulovorans]|uniref:Flagellar biosynthesis domain-containing protein n=1 Tax=Clostridium cellulovorans (strain ATCC 35296 / DSM 3052 / OCM 3 / 743B) TaxID=573061 RepID=D9SKH5_CLOC7|nr:flagellar biosynthetic protein FliO [Clostridium cellulovorans]ADL51471.1 flagellar biosynthesis domain-containing protein [Clostridium cellulovorans 743B]